MCPIDAGWITAEEVCQGVDRGVGVGLRVTATT